MENLIELLRPETELEKRIIEDSDFIAGAFWGKSRNGHPEGKVAYHIKEVLANVDKYSTHLNREKLRLIALIHDTFKHKVDGLKPKSGDNHHAMIARKFAERFNIEKDVLDIIELHDEAYNAWSMGDRKGDWNGANKRLGRLLDRLDDNYQLYKTFYQCDNETGDKTQKNFEWFCDYIIA